MRKQRWLGAERRPRIVDARACCLLVARQLPTVAGGSAAGIHGGVSEASTAATSTLIGVVSDAAGTNDKGSTSTPTWVPSRAPTTSAP